MAMILMFLRVLAARFRGRPLDLELPGGRRIHLFPDGRLLPGIAGADGADENENEDGDEGDNSDSDSGRDGDSEDEDSEKLGDAGKAALEAERKARKAAEKAAREAEKRAKKLEDEKLSDEDKLKKRAEEGDRKSEKATAKLRMANLLTELSSADHGLVDPRAAIKLIEDIEFDDDDEPTNVEDRVKALIAQYPFLKADGKRSDSTDTANPPANRKTADEKADDAKLSGWMKSAFGIGGDDK